MKKQSYFRQMPSGDTLFGWIIIVCCLFSACGSPSKTTDNEQENGSVSLKLVGRESDETISMVRTDRDEPILVQRIRADFRPYIHPILAPDGKGILTEYSPGRTNIRTGYIAGLPGLMGVMANTQATYWCNKY